MEQPEMLTYDEASAYTGVKKNTLYSMVAKRQIPFVRIGPRIVRFPRTALVRWLAERLVVPVVVSSSGGRRATNPKSVLSVPRLRGRFGAR